MVKTITQRAFLALACCLALVLAPAAVGAQTQDTTTQQDRPLSNQQQPQQPETGVDAEADTDVNIQQEDDQERMGEDAEQDLPATAGGLPIAALMGMLSLAGVGVSRLIARARQ
jgi:hypothetical protein